MYGFSLVGRIVHCVKSLVHGQYVTLAQVAFQPEISILKNLMSGLLKC